MQGKNMNLRIWLRGASWMNLCVLTLAGCGSQLSPLAARYYNEGNSLFEKAEFHRAIQKYEEAVQTGARDGELFYNLGTAYFQAGNIGNTVLWYLRARKLMPRDMDLNDNLTRARNSRKDSFTAPHANALTRVWERAIDQVTLTETLAMEAFLFVLVTMAVLVRILVPSLRKRRGSIFSLGLLLILWLFTCVFGASKIYRETHVQPGVILPEEAKGHTGPGVEFPVAFTIHAGAEVTLKQKQGTWQQIVLPNGWTGWVRQDSVERV